MNDRKNTQNGQQQQAAAPTMQLSDIYFILFRHKWKILLFSVLGIAAATVLYFFKPPLYTSAAKIYISAVADTKPLSNSGTQIRSADDRGDNIIGTEVEILTSLDIAQEVVKRIGAERIMAALGGGNDTNAAAGFIKKNITVAPVKHSDVLLIVFQHPDKRIVQPVLDEIINVYAEQHLKIHLHLGESGIGESGDFLSKKVEETRSQLANASQELRKAQEQAGIVSLDDAKKANSGRIARLQDEIMTAQASLAEHEAALKKMVRPAPAAASNTTTNAAAEVPSDKISDYRGVCLRLDQYLHDRADLLTWCTTNNQFVLDKQKQIDAIQGQKTALEAKYPKLASLILPLPSVAGTSPTAVLLDPNAEAVQVEGFRARVNFLTNELAQAQSDEARVENWEGTIETLQTKKDLLETQFRSFSAKLEDARFNEALDSAKLSSIGIPQKPSPAYRDMMQLYKLLGIVVAVGILGGIGLAFLIEMFLDPTFKRPNEIEARLHLPLFLTIPDTRNGNGNGHALSSPNQKLLTAPPTNGESSTSMAVAKATSTPLWDANHKLRPFFDALRDRLVNYFDLNNLTHNPKIIAITSCGEGAGVSTVAAGLAATLSETGEGNVLLVDMNQGKGVAALDFHRGKPALNITEALEESKRDGAMVQDNLYVVEGSRDDKNLGILPKQFAYLVPKLRASDYDYIIFDMPPVSQISVTSKLARLMDVNLLVVESEKTGRDVAKQATDMLTGSKAKVGVVLNKRRSYVPQWLHQEL